MGLLQFPHPGTLRSGAPLRPGVYPQPPSQPPIPQTLHSPGFSSLPALVLTLSDIAFSPQPLYPFWGIYDQGEESVEWKGLRDKKVSKGQGQEIGIPGEQMVCWQTFVSSSPEWGWVSGVYIPERAIPLSGCLYGAPSNSPVLVIQLYRCGREKLIEKQTEWDTEWTRWILFWSDWVRSEVSPGDGVKLFVLWEVLLSVCFLRKC